MKDPVTMNARHHPFEVALRLTWHVALALLAGSLPVAGSQSPATVELSGTFISQLAEELRTNHPALRASQARVSAAAAEADSVRTWEDPMLTLGGMFADEDMRAEDGDIIYGIEQKLPLFGRPQLARAVAKADLGRTTQEAEFQFQVLRRDLAQALFRTALAHRVIEIASEDLEWLSRMVQTTDQRYQAGQATLTDLLRVQTELRQQQERLETDRRLRDHEQFTLNRMLNRSLQAPWPNLQFPEPARPVVFSTELVDLARRYEPRLQILRKEIESAEAASRLTRRSRLPEVVLGAQARNYTGNGDFRQAEVMLGFTLPWGNAAKYRRDYERDRSRVAVVQQEAADYALGIAEELHALTVRIDAARREALAYRDDIIPRTEQALQSAQNNWLSGRSLFFEVMESRRLLLDARLTYHRAVAEQYNLLVELVLCCGLGDLESLEMIGATASTPTASNPVSTSR